MKIGIVGHRFLDNENIFDFVTHHSYSILTQFKEKYNNIIALSAIAEGADTIFAEKASALNIPFKVIIPFKNYIEDFKKDNARTRYLNLLDTAACKIRLEHKYRSDQAYYDAMKWVVEESDILVAVWNGQDGNGIGGTAEAVKLVVKLKKDWVHINVKELNVKYFNVF